MELVKNCSVCAYPGLWFT